MSDLVLLIGGLGLCAILMIGVAMMQPEFWIGFLSGSASSFSTNEEDRELPEDLKRMTELADRAIEARRKGEPLPPLEY